MTSNTLFRLREWLRLLGLHRSPHLAGHIDGLERTHVAGWALRSDGKPAELRIAVDNQIVDIITPSNPRPDLAPFFAGSTCHGFHFVFSRPLPEGAMVSITDCKGRHLKGSPGFVPTADITWLTSSRRWGLAKHYLAGTGIEIGALHKPLPVSPSVAVQYVDHLSKSDLYRLHPEMTAFDIVEPDIVTNGETLDGITDASQDFVIANHLIEHTEDPIQTLKSFARVLCPGGIIFMAVPDKRFTFDRDRPTTTIEHLVRDHRDGPDVSRRDHYLEYAALAGDKDLLGRAAEMEARQLDIHFHVWTPLSFGSFLNAAVKEFGIPFDCEAMVQNGDEFIIILRKAENS